MIVITPTGDRPQQLALCAEYLSRQSRQPTAWIVVDDGEEPSEEAAGVGATYIRRERSPEDPAHTLVVNMRTGINQVKNEDEICVVMEDDDWYDPRYLENVEKWMLHADIAGEADTHYYYFSERKKIEYTHVGHCSLFKTAFRKRFFQQTPLPDDWRLDLTLWRTGEGRKKVVKREKPLAVGMKGLPGRRGLSSGWDLSRKEWTEDPDRSWLRSIIGKDDLRRMERIWA